MAGATQDFKVRISAQDNASGTLTALNKRMASINKEAARARKPFDDLASNAKRFASVTGIDKIAAGMGNVARSGFDAFRSVSRIVEPLAAISGVASIAGMMKLATAWADFGTNLGNASTRAGITADQMMALQNAGRLAGVSAEGVSSAMAHLHDSMVDAMGGRAPQVVAMMNALFGPDAAMGKIKQYAQDGAKALPELSDKIVGLHDPTLMALAGTTLLGGAFEQITPLMRKGSAGIAELTDRARKYGLMNDDGVASANRLREAQTGLTEAVEGLGNSISNALAPVLTPMLEQMRDWIVANREWISQGIGAKVKEFADYLKNGGWEDIKTKVHGLYDEVKGLVDEIGGIVKVGEYVAGYMAVSWAAKMLGSILAVSRALGGIGLAGALPALELGAVGLADHFAGPQGSNDNVRSEHPTALGRWIYDQSSALRGLDNSMHSNATRDQWAADMAQFTSYGWTKAQAAGVLGGFERESGGDATRVGDNGQAYGLGQWHPDRQAAFASLYGHDIRQGTHAEQIGLANWELRNTEADAGRRLAATSTQYQSAYVASKYYERPADPTGTEALVRGQNADRMMALGPALSLPANAGTAALPGGAGVMPNGEVAITARFANTPAGMTTTAVQSGTGMTPLRVERSGVGYANGMLGAA